MAVTLKDKIIKTLIETQGLTKANIDEAITLQRKKGISLDRALMEKGFIKEKDYLILLVRELNIPFINLSKYNIDPALKEVIPEKVARQYKIIPLSELTDTLTIAMSDPLNIFVIDDLKNITGKQIDIVISTQSEIDKALTEAGNPTGVMVQIGTRNAQNFELLKSAGQQTRFPVLYKRGMGIQLEEAFNACEYIASEGNRRVIFCLRGVKSNLGDPHRNFVDVSHVPVVKRLTRMPVCFDPSHSVGRRDADPSRILDISHVSAQAVIAGANMLLVDFHPDPERALCDGPQALLVDDLKRYLDDVQITRNAFEQRRALAAGS